MTQHTRNPRPQRIVWLQDDVLHKRYYWLAVDQPKARTKLVVELRGQVIQILERGEVDQLTLRLDDTMLDLEQEVVVREGERELLRVIPKRTLAILAATLMERGDPKAIFVTELRVEL